MALKKIKTPDFMASINEAKMLHSQKEEITEAVCEQTEETVIPENSCKRSLPKNTNCPKRHSTKTKFIRSKSPYDVLAPPDHGLQ